MSLSQEALLELMAYADGELEGEDRARIEKLLEGSEEARAVVASFGPLGDTVRAVEDERAVKAGADGIVDDVMARLAAEAPVPIHEARRGKARGVRLVAGMGAALALAAGVAMMVRGGFPGGSAGTEGPTPESVAGGGATGPQALASGTVESREAPSGVEVETVESADTNVALFYLPASAGANVNASSVVVWITDEPAQRGDL